jgi:flagellar hook-basal body complex protein FliE
MNPFSVNPFSMLQGSALANPALQGLPGDLIQQGAAKTKAIPQVEIDKLSSGFSARDVKAPGSAGGAFDNVLSDLVTQVNQKQIASKDMVNGLLTGQNVSLHQAVIAMEEASVSFQLMAEVRNKLLESYQELMRMQM